VKCNAHKVKLVVGVRNLAMRLDPVFGMFLAGTSLFLVVEHVYMVGPMLFALFGLYDRWRKPELAAMPDALQRSWRSLLCGFWGFAASVIFLNFLHGDTAARNFERIIPFALLPALVWAVRSRLGNLRHWLLAVGIGCCLAFAVAMHDTLVLAEPRAVGASNNAIVFGAVSVVMGTICAMAAATLAANSISILFRLFLIFSALCAVGASLLSGSKGGWVAMIIVTVAVAAFATSQMKFSTRVFLGLACIVVIACLALLAPDHIVRARLLHGLHGAIGWFSDGSMEDRSVSARLELIRLGIQLYAEAPIFGLGTSGLAQRWLDFTGSGASFAHLSTFSTLDNEFMGALAEGGIVGALGYYGVYLGAFIAFWPWRRHSDATVRYLALTGLLLVPVHLLFGLSISVFGRSMFRVEFVMFASTLFAFLSLRIPAKSS